MHSELISSATQKNWSRLNNSSEGRLKSRANKKCSNKIIIPAEYIENQESIDFLNLILSLRSANQWTIADMIFTLAHQILSKSALAEKKHVKDTLAAYDFALIDELKSINIPHGERDILGLVYQTCLSEGEKNMMGSYYTPRYVVERMTRALTFDDGELLLDPCCGSGSFFLDLKNIAPHQIVGVDRDPIAVLIAKVNLLLMFANDEFEPQVFHQDYLSETDLFSTQHSFLQRSFDYIVTNPPWCDISKGSQSPEEIVSNESFSCFFVKAYKQLNDKGIIKFLFPESILNVKQHCDIRTFMLKNCRINSLTLYNDSFTGVTTKYISIDCSKEQARATVDVFEGDKSYKVDVTSFEGTQHKVFSLLTREEQKIIHSVNDHGKYTLADSLWALGVVTGDNKGKLKDEMIPKSEPILTGKEIAPYRLKPARKYLVFDRTQLQQVAKDEFYRAEEKLVYKFISNRLTFAYDNEQRLFLNSANILIPKIPGMSIKTVMAFLNSPLFQFYYVKVFSEIKILKGNLLHLPFPVISKKTNLDIEALVDKIMQGESDHLAELHHYLYRLYNFTQSQINLIEKTPHGST